MDEKDWLLFFGVFFSETIKNIAKGTANTLQNNVGSFLKTEIISLNLNTDDTNEEIQKKIESMPEVKAEIQKKLETNSDLLNELKLTLNKEKARIINTKTYIEYVSNLTINQ
ncbi:MAG: hypothetical protein MUC29_13630 [Pyrinomonadaceae bacterium]|jgi:hypothetical protein|nr:hypothetical protein [Pyrinomonadaceae bacterium]